MASDTELEPCPLCDGPAEIHMSGRGGGFVKCKDYNCGCSTAWFDDVQMAVDRWNNRVGGLSIPINSFQTNRVGNAAAMREACANIAEYAKSAQCHTEDAHVLGYLRQMENWAQAAVVLWNGYEYTVPTLPQDEFKLESEAANG